MLNIGDLFYAWLLTEDGSTRVFDNEKYVWLNASNREKLLLRGMRSGQYSFDTETMSRFANANPSLVSACFTCDNDQWIGRILVHNPVILLRYLERQGISIVRRNIDGVDNRFVKITFSSGDGGVYSLITWDDEEYAWAMCSAKFYTVLMYACRDDVKKNYMRFEYVDDIWKTSIFESYVHDLLPEGCNMLNLYTDTPSLEPIGITDAKFKDIVSTIIGWEPALKVEAEDTVQCSDGWTKINICPSDLCKIQNACAMVDTNLYEQLGTILNAMEE